MLARLRDRDLSKFPLDSVQVSVSVLVSVLGSVNVTNNEWSYYFQQLDDQLSKLKIEAKELENQEKEFQKKEEELKKKERVRAYPHLAASKAKSESVKFFRVLLWISVMES